MKIKLTQTYLDENEYLDELERRIAEQDEKLKTPGWTLDDIILHIELLKELNSLT